jgi:hypothetical protein
LFNAKNAKNAKNEEAGDRQAWRGRPARGFRLNQIHAGETPALRLISFRENMILGDINEGREGNTS